MYPSHFQPDSHPRLTLEGLLARSGTPRGDATSLWLPAAVAVGLCAFTIGVSGPFGAWSAGPHGGGLTGDIFHWAHAIVAVAGALRWAKWVAVGDLAVMVSLAVVSRLWREATFGATATTVVAISIAGLLAAPIVLAITFLFVCLATFVILMVIFCVVCVALLIFVLAAVLSDL